MGKQLKEAYGNVFAEMAKLSKAAAKIDETQVYEEANLETRKYMKKRLSLESYIRGTDSRPDRGRLRYYRFL